jgi:putative transposase
MLINQIFRYELNPNDKQITKLIKCCGVSRFVWNWALSKRLELYKTNSGKARFTTSFNQNKELDLLKRNEYSWLQLVPKSIVEERLRDLRESYSHLTRRIKYHDNKIGVPKFKKKGVHDSFRVRNNSYDKRIKYDIRVLDNNIRIPKIGFIKSKESTSKINGRILSATVSRDADRWFCSLCVEVERPNPRPIQGDVIGIDIGIKTFGTVSNGTETYELVSPKPLRKRIDRVKRLHHQLSKKKKGSKNKKKAQLALVRAYRKIKNIRKDFLAKESTKLAKTKSVICIEILNVKGMVHNHHLARSIGDEGWGTFRRMLEYKTKWYGSKLVVIPRFEPSSKKCNSCGTVNKDLKLSDRTWVCLSCGAINERDENAAKNIRECGIKILNTESSSGINAYGVGVSPQQLEAVHDEVGSKHYLDNKGKSYGTV